MKGRNRGIQEARQDLVGNFEIERENIKAQFQEVKAGRKEAEGLRRQLDELRQYFLVQIKIADSVIDRARFRANEVLKARVETATIEYQRHDPASTKKMQELADLQAYSELMDSTARSKTDEDYMNDLDAKHHFGGRRITTAEADQLEAWRDQEETRAASTLDTTDSASKLLGKMREGRKKKGKGGIDYTAGGQVVDFYDLYDLDTDTELVKNLDSMLEKELETVMERAVFTSRTIQQFEGALDPVLKRWEAGQYNTRGKVRNFIADKLVALCNTPSMEPVMKVQVKALLYKRGIFKGLTRVAIPK